MQLEVAELDKKPHLAVILVGDDSASKLYVGMKEKMATKLGMSSTVLKYSYDTSEQDIIEKIKVLNSDDDIDAILVQLPLPEHISEQRVIQAISPIKDVDGFTPENIGKFLLAFSQMHILVRPLVLSD